MRPLSAQLRAEVTMIFTNGETLFLTLGIPVVFLLFFSAVHVLPTGTRHPVDFLVPGILALAVMSTSMTALSIGTGFERGYGVLKRLGSTPLSRAGLLTAKTLNVLVLEVIQAPLERTFRIYAHDYPFAYSGWHHHPEYELHLIRRSRGHFYVGTYAGEFGPGNLVMTGPNLPHMWISSANERDEDGRGRCAAASDRSRTQTIEPCDRTPRGSGALKRTRPAARLPSRDNGAWPPADAD